MLPALTPDGRYRLLGPLARVEVSPIVAAERRRRSTNPAPGLPVIDLSQAAPAGAPAPSLRRHLAAAVSGQGDIHGYGPVLGDDALRAEIATRWSSIYRARIHEHEVGITAGCNQAFCAALASIAAPGDEVVLPAPWYFNHKMWLDSAGVRVRPLALSAATGFLPDPADVAGIVTPRTRAIVIITPNNPTGSIVGSGILTKLLDIARESGAVLVVDETYRDFQFPHQADHGLFRHPAWREHFVHLYSFSKTYRLTGYRTGAIVTGEDRLAEIEKFLDTVAICAPRMGQAAALFGLRELGGWVENERRGALRRLSLLQELFASEPGGFRLSSAGAYFAYLRHPFEESSDVVAERLLSDASLLVLDGLAFGPPRSLGGDGEAERHLRLAFANVREPDLREVVSRLGRLGR